MYDHHHVNMSLTWHIMSLLTYCREVQTKQATVCLSWNAFPVLRSCSAPLFFIFSVFIIAPQRKINLDEKRSKRNRKKNEARECEKNDRFFRGPTSTQTSNPITPFWQWGIVGLKAVIQGPASSRECIVPHRGPHGVQGAPERTRGASRPQTQRGPSHLGRKGSMGARQRARERPQTCERVPTGASWDWLGIVSLQHSGNRRKWQPRSRLLTQSKRKAFNCCEKSARKGKACC